jgi:hypothetical protein
MMLLATRAKKESGSTQQGDSTRAQETHLGSSDLLCEQQPGNQKGRYRDPLARKLLLLRVLHHHALLLLLLLRDLFDHRATE